MVDYCRKSISLVKDLQEIALHKVIYIYKILKNSLDLNSSQSVKLAFRSTNIRNIVESWLLNSISAIMDEPTLMRTVIGTSTTATVW